MFKKITIFMVAVTLFASLAFSQTMMLKPFGISPRDAERDTLDIFDRAYNGLLNVGVETQMYLKGTLIGASLASPVWIVTGPTGSAATITTTMVVDSSTQVAVFTPDVKGTYTVEFKDGSYSATLTINAGTYVGIEAGSCTPCHDNATFDFKTTEWEKTGHYSLFERGLNGEASSHYAAFCISCHTTGYDVNARNNGFDDREFVFPDSLFPGVFDSMMVKYPDAMKLARVQCESCHGPGSAHYGVTSDSKMVSSLSSANCAWCHDAGTHHVYPEQWDVSGHAHVPSYPGGARTSCQGCHNGAQFVQQVKGEEITKQPYTPITCPTCHDPHSEENDHQVRTVEATLSNGEVVTQGGLGKLCMNCHQSRRDAATYTEEPHRYYGPHYAPQADILTGTNAVTFGKKLPTSPHLSAIENACVDCHMAPGHELDPAKVVGSHSFKVTSEEGVDHVEICEGCHGDVGESFAEKKFYFNGSADHDGDGVEEGLQEEVEGLMDKLAALLPDPDPHAQVDSTWTKTELKAAFNHRLVHYDGSDGIHNPAFTVALLKVSIQALINNAIEGEIVAIDDVPNDQGKQVRIIWDKFVDDGIAVDPIATYLVKRLDGENDWTGVGQYPAHGADRYALVVPTLYDSTAEGNAMTTFKVVAVSRGGTVHESLPAQGYSVDNLVPHAPGNLMALTSLGDVELSWEAPGDPDINYYKVYRSTQPIADPAQATELGATTELAFTDVQPGLGTFYYAVIAFDFSGNMGRLSASVSASLTSVADAGNVPLKYELSQNYPNPFNPETTIHFGVKNPGHVTLEIYNSTGQMVAKLVDRNMAAGNYQVNFIADGLSTGVYVYRIKISSGEGVQFQAVKKMILMK